MSDEEMPEWRQQINFDDLVIVEYEKYLNLSRKCTEIVEGVVYAIGDYGFMLCQENSTLYDSQVTNERQLIPYHMIQRLKNLSTDYDSGELHE